MNRGRRTTETDPDGVRVVERRSAPLGPRHVLGILLLVLVLGGATKMWMLDAEPPAPTMPAAAQTPDGEQRLPPSVSRTPLTVRSAGGRERARVAPRSARHEAEHLVPAAATRAAKSGKAPVLKSEDQISALVDDMVQAARAAGEREGIAAFPRPGTDPIRLGLVVPDDFELPEGYIRHYQITDDGRRLEPILMFSPDYEFVDAAGQPVALPENGIVPAEMAPAGMPLRALEKPERPYGVTPRTR